MFGFFRKKQQPIEVPAFDGGIFSTHIFPNKSPIEAYQEIFRKNFQKSAKDHYKAVDAKGNAIAMDAVAMDDSSNLVPLVPQAYDPISGGLMNWFGSQNFIGYQNCAILSQHWLIDKACTMPAQDASRNGYEVTVNDGTEVDIEVFDYIRHADKRFNINANLVEFERMGRIFGIRIAMFIVESKDPDYYLKPFNPDGITPGSYKGISQIDPFWIFPELDQQSAANPQNIFFYEPTWWRVNGQRIHKTHLIIMRNGEVPDILKPTYLYGGVPLPQKIAERVYAAERTANEGPLLALTKRMVTYKVDTVAAAAQGINFFQTISNWIQNWSNVGVKVIGLKEDISSTDTSLNDLDMVIMTQYQLVCSVAGTPATKLLGVSPKGFNATGEFELKSYHELLESIREHHLTPLLERHHLLLIRSEICPQFKIKPFGTSINWLPLSSDSSLEIAQTNLAKAQADNELVQAGAIDGQDIRNRLISDRDSGYNGITDKLPEIEDDAEENDTGD